MLLWSRERANSYNGRVSTGSRLTRWCMLAGARACLVSTQRWRCASGKMRTHHLSRVPLQVVVSVIRRLYLRVVLRCKRVCWRKLQVAPAWKTNAYGRRLSAGASTSASRPPAARSECYFLKLLSREGLEVNGSGAYRPRQLLPRGARTPWRSTWVVNMSRVERSWL